VRDSRGRAQIAAGLSSGRSSYGAIATQLAGATPGALRNEPAEQTPAAAALGSKNAGSGVLVRWLCAPASIACLSCSQWSARFSARASSPKKRQPRFGSSRDSRQPLARIAGAGGRRVRNSSASQSPSSSGAESLPSAGRTAHSTQRSGPTLGIVEKELQRKEGWPCKRVNPEEANLTLDHIGRCRLHIQAHGSLHICNAPA